MTYTYVGWFVGTVIAVVLSLTIVSSALVGFLLGGALSLSGGDHREQHRQGTPMKTHGGDR